MAITNKKEILINEIEKIDKEIEKDIKKSKKDSNQSGFLYYLEIVDLSLLEKRLKLLKKYQKL